MTSKRINFVWFFLLTLTLASVLLTYFVPGEMAFIIIVMLFTAIKGQQIVDYFMELAHAPKKWRHIFVGYVVVLPLLIMSIYIY